MHKIFTLSFFIFTILDLGASPKNIAFKHLGISEGFFQTNITSLYQDDNGAMWVAGRNGVFRYHGNLPEERVAARNGEQFRPLSTKTIHGEQSGVVYLCQLVNVIEYDLKKETFRPLFSPEILDGRAIAVMCVSNAAVYAVARDEVLMYSDGVESSYVKLEGLSEVSAIMCGSTGELYLGTLSDGLYKVGADREVVKVIGTNSKINSIIEDRAKNTWITTRSEGIYVIDQQKNIRQFKHDPNNPKSLVDNYVRCICEDDNGLLWIGTMYGLDCYDPKSGEFHHYGKSKDPLYGLRNLTVECIMKDRQGTIWVGSYYTGLSYFNTESTRFSTIPVVTDDATWTVVADMVLDNRGDIWACTSDKGLYYYNRRSGQSRFYDMSNSNISSNNIKCIQYDKAGDGLWLGAFMGGTIYMDIRRGLFTHIELEADEMKSPSENTEIVHSLTAFDGSVYIATYAGVYRLDKQTREIKKIINEERIFNILVDENYDIYVVGSLNRFKVYGTRGGDKTPRLKFSAVFKQDLINSIFKDSKGRIWLATTQSGLIMFDKKRMKFVVYNVDNTGIESNNISSINELLSGHILIGTEKGMSVVDVERYRSMNYNSYNGFPLASMLNGCIYRASSGEMFLGGTNDIVSFDESRLLARKQVPNICFSSLTVNHRLVYANDKTGILKQAMPYTKKISLSHQQTLLDIKFGSDDYADFNPDSYQYMLEGYDRRWNNFSKHNSINYMNLPAGSYTLKVKSKATQLTGNGDGISLGIDVHPPYYATIYAYILYVLLIIGTTFLVIRYYYSKKHLEDSLRLERNDKEQKELITQWKLVFFTNISHEFRTPLTLILGQLDLMMNKSMVLPAYHDHLFSIRRNANRLKLLVNELIDFRKLEQGYMTLKVSEVDIIAYIKDICDSFGQYADMNEITLNFTSDVAALPLFFDAVQLQKVFYNLISNSFKHMDKGGQIDIVVFCRGNRVVMKFTDTGHGIEQSRFETIFERFYHYDKNSSETGVGIGLSLAKGIVTLHEGEIFLESKVGVGTTFTVEMLLGNSHFIGKERVEIVESSQMVLHPRIDMVSHATFDINQLHGNHRPLRHILIVEDDLELSRMLATIFSQFYSVDIASNGQEGYCKAKQNQPNIIVSDVLMPIMSGTEMCERLKADFDTCHIPVVLLTALTSTEQNIVGLESGADDYILKPFDVNMLLTKCNSLLRNREILQSKFLNEPVSSVKNITTNDLDEAFVNKTVEFIEANMSNNMLDINLLCREMAVSRTALFAKVKGLVGQTPTELISSIRLKRAAWLLKRYPEMRIIEIAEQVGFNSIQYFGKAFKAHFNVTPSEYRQL